ncbi:iron ABC transporter permease [Corynebacteriales bacterium D3-21]|uniref:Iron ABC transporter permease n=2 Tax=Speluncibacter jeojiensis TaxID=2710754 RepID=A0A9X4M1I6_9ACTN|nr:iron ABC transporter permease [Rhodococcus sp. D2-41]MDG3016179.1 iron ABC transporter permease [Corynebacteriales bacterium D3-21]
MVAAAFVPLGFVVVETAGAGWDTIRELVFRGRVGELLVNTGLLVAVTVPLCVVLGVGAAWLVERTTVFGSRLWAPALAAPLAVPAFVNSYAWVTVIPSLHGLFSGVLIATLSYFPLVYLPVLAALRRLDAEVEESARALGCGPWAVFFRVVLPQLRLAVLGGALLVALHLLSEYGAFAMIRFDTFTTAIFEQFQSTFDGAAGTMLAAVLVLCCLLVLLLEAVSRGRARYARVGSGTGRRAGRTRLGWRQLPAFAALTALLVLALGVPLWVIGRWLVRGGAGVWDGAEMLPALGQTLQYGLIGGVVTVVLAFPTAWLAVRFPGRFTKIVEGCNYITSSLPGIVVALALITVTINWLHPWYQTTTVVFVAYALMFLPRALVNLRAGLAQVPVELEEAARSLGRPPLVAFARVTLRLTAPAAASGIALVFLAIATELTATLMLTPTGTETLATRFWALTGELDYSAAAPFALIMVVVSLPITYLLFRQSQKVAGV